jgi:hypothetical protein
LFTTYCLQVVLGYSPLLAGGRLPAHPRCLPTRLLAGGPKADAQVPPRALMAHGATR